MFNRKKRRSAKSAKTQALSPRALRRAFTLTATIVIFGAAAMVLMVEAPRIQHRLAARSTSEPARIIIEWPISNGASATWLPSEVQHELLASAYHELERHPDPFSGVALSRIAASLEATGWFDQIRRVKRESGNTIRVEAAWRIPAAVVRHGNVDYLISRRGELLRLEYQPNRSPLPAIIGARFDPPSINGQLAYGEPWPGADVRAGLEVLTMVNSRPWRDQVAAVDVSNYLALRRLELITQWDGRAIWGGAPSDAIPGEVTAQRKLQRLDVLYHQFQRIDARRRIVEVAGPVTLVDDSPSGSAS